MGLDLASRITKRPAPSTRPRVLHVARNRRRPHMRRTPHPPLKRIPVPQSTNSPRSERKFNALKHGNSAVEDIDGLRRLESDLSSLVVATDGSCTNNGYASAKAGYGVFFTSSPLSSYLNTHGLVPQTSPQTSQYAELYAVMKALEIIHQLMIGGQEISHVVFKTDSEYVELGLSRHVWKWMGNGWRNAKGDPVVNGRAFRYLHERIGLLEMEYGVLVSFCRVARDYNLQADALAKLPLLRQQGVAALEA